MIGNNELILNEATMREAVQYWLTNRVFNKDERSPEVVSVSSTRDDHANEFKISLHTPDPLPAQSPTNYAHAKHHGFTA